MIPDIDIWLAANQLIERRGGAIQFPLWGV